MPFSADRVNTYNPPICLMITALDYRYYQWRVQEFVKGGPKFERLFFAFQFFRGGLHMAQLRK